MICARNRALSLLEVLVTMAIFGVLITAVVLIEVGMRSSRPREDAHSQAFRSVTLAGEFLRSELTGAYVQPQNTLALTYYPTVRADARVPLGPSGVAEAQPETVLQRESDGRLVRLQGSERRVVCQLGQQGEFSFHFVRSNLLQVHLKAVPSELGSYSSEVSLFLANQQ